MPTTLDTPAQRLKRIRLDAEAETAIRRWRLAGTVTGHARFMALGFAVAFSLAAYAGGLPDWMTPDTVDLILIGIASLFPIAALVGIHLARRALKAAIKAEVARQLHERQL